MLIGYSTVSFTQCIYTGFNNNYSNNLCTLPRQYWSWCGHIDGLVQERHNSIANALELRLSCTNPMMCERIISEPPQSLVMEMIAMLIRWFMLLDIANDMRLLIVIDVYHSQISNIWIDHVEQELTVVVNMELGPLIIFNQTVFLADKSTSMPAPIAWTSISTLRQRQNGRHFSDDIFKCVFLNENVWIVIKIPLKFVPNGPIHYVQHCCRYWLGIDKVISHYLKQWWFVYWRLYVCHSATMS